MVASSLASITFILVTTVFGIPISGTHAFVGGLLGAGMAALGPRALDHHMLVNRVVVSWFASPAVAAVICFIFIAIVSLMTLNGAKASLWWKLFNLQLVSGFTIAFITLMLMLLILKNNTP
jgi:PiT family inorganic phosphate transporter